MDLLNDYKLKTYRTTQRALSNKHVALTNRIYKTSPPNMYVVGLLSGFYKSEIHWGRVPDKNIWKQLDFKKQNHKGE